MECLVSFTNCELHTLQIQVLWTMTLCDKHVTHTHSHIQCNPMTFHMHNKYDELGNKHVKDILYVICSIHVNQRIQHLYSLHTFECQHRYIIIVIQSIIPTNSHLPVISFRHTFDSHSFQARF